MLVYTFPRLHPKRTLGKRRYQQHNYDYKSLRPPAGDELLETLAIGFVFDQLNPQSH